MSDSELSLKKCFVIGAGGHSRVLISILQEPHSQYQVLGILDLQKADFKERILGVPIVGDIEELRNKQERENINLFLAIGDNQKRAECFDWVQSLGYNVPNLISRLAYIDPTAKLGLGNVICPLAFVGPMTIIGNNNILNTRCLVEHETLIGNHCHVAPSALLAGRAEIGDNVFVGLGAKVIDYVKITSQTIIGAGAVVIKDIEKKGVYAGVPAHEVGQ